jgi:hypothetical protein
MSDSTSAAPGGEPPKREFRFKPTEFERANPSAGTKEVGPPISVQDMFRQAASAKPPPPNRPVAPATNEVHDILRANLEKANEDGANDVELKPKRASRRKRDYWLLTIAVNLFFLLSMAFFRNLGTFVFGGAGIIFCNLGLVWVMWFVMDDY